MIITKRLDRRWTAAKIAHPGSTPGVKHVWSRLGHHSHCSGTRIYVALDRIRSLNAARPRQFNEVSAHVQNSQPSTHISDLWSVGVRSVVGKQGTALGLGSEIIRENHQPQGKTSLRRVFIAHRKYPDMSLDGAQFTNFCASGVMFHCTAAYNCDHQKQCRFYRKASSANRCMFYREHLASHCDCVDAQRAIGGGVAEFS